ncbi:hypothetical protein C1I98_11260 [Spongiactinospora gelatinilytica]|uniref:Integral membrane protein n=1 Tax=Spongiactinospora gelatinilytica TaxID=2666298 RepID=A0A2W2GML3_9ACTN|nr:hypothetical protein [Spongiactinospora gelatinilytica]PZG49821.1 hypothetical protein C1I98_11260 [Spongiactinospora gelatinilytica]
MPHLLSPSKSRPFRLTLNTDGVSHPIENTLSVATLVCGLVAFVTGFVSEAHILASWVGALGFGGGLYSQYVSATTAERSVNIVGIVAAFVGVSLGIYHGGFVP